MLLITGPPLSGFSGRRFFFRKGSEEHLSDLRKLPQPWCRAIPKRGRPFSSQEASDHKFRAETEENRIHKRQNRKRRSLGSLTKIPQSSILLDYQNSRYRPIGISGRRWRISQ